MAPSLGDEVVVTSSGFCYLGRIVGLSGSTVVVHVGAENLRFLLSNASVELANAPKTPTPAPSRRRTTKKED